MATWNLNSLRARLEAVGRFLERAALARVVDAGLVDVDVARWGPHARRFTWWDLGMGYQRDLGMRLDVIAADRTLAARLETTWIDHLERAGPRPSDHAALVADFRLPASRAVESAIPPSCCVRVDRACWTRGRR